MENAKVTIEITITNIDKETGIATFETIASVPNSGEVLMSFPTLFIEAGGSVVINNISMQVDDA
jgi:hypothetical protein